MKNFDIKKCIALVRRIADGDYEPTTDFSRDNLAALFRCGPYFGSLDLVKRDQLSDLRKLAKKHGYQIFTSIKVLTNKNKDMGVSMKNIIVTVVLLASLATHSFAWEFKRNPDRFPSVAFNVSDARLSGNRSEVDLPGTWLQRAQGGDESQNLKSIGGDIRLPVNEAMTLSLFYDHLESDHHYNRDPGIFTDTNSLSGYRAGFSFRLYLN